MNSDTVEKVILALGEHGIKARALSIKHLPEIRKAVRVLVADGSVSTRLSTNWHFYLDNPVPLPNAGSILITAIPQSVLRLGFIWNGRTYQADIAPTYVYAEDENKAHRIVREVLESHGFSAAKARLPLKTTAVLSGLARYGKNNISYVSGIGSFYRLAAFYTDCDCIDTVRAEPQMMPECQNCFLCEEACPAGSISTEKFLIKADRCLGARCERDNNFTYWVTQQPEYPQAFIGCMACQFSCPVNEPLRSGNIKEMPLLNEAETDAILKKTSLSSLASATRIKLGNPSEYVYGFFSGNLKALIRKQDTLFTGAQGR